MTKTTLAFIALTGFAGCGQSDMDMNHSLDEWQAHIEALSTDSAGHAQQVTGVADLSAALTLETGHYDRIMGHADGMMGNMNDMHMCRLSGRGPDLSAMAGEIDDLRGECTGHRSAMLKATDLAAALAEENRHQTAMHMLIERLRQTRDGMMGQAGAFSCPMHGMH